MSKKIKSILISLSLIFVSLAVVFFFWDLEISKAMVQENPNFIFLLLHAVGEFPIYIGPIMFALVYGFTSERKNVRLLSHMFGLMALYVAMIRLSEGILETFMESTLGILQYSLLALASLFLYVFLFVLVNKVNHDNLEKIKDIALMYLVVSLSSFIIVSGVKLIWGRARFVTLSEDYSEFTNFLTINGFSRGELEDGYRSFPSGHTNAATSILLLSLIPCRFTNKKWVKYLVFSVLLAYVFTVAISRVCLGAHYASDVLFGFGINIICSIIVYVIFKKKGWLNVRSDKR